MSRQLGPRLPMSHLPSRSRSRLEEGQWSGPRSQSQSRAFLENGVPPCLQPPCPWVPGLPSGHGLRVSHAVSLRAVCSWFIQLLVRAQTQGVVGALWAS